MGYRIMKVMSSRKSLYTVMVGLCYIEGYNIKNGDL